MSPLIPCPEANAYGWPIENELVPGLTECAFIWGMNPAARWDALTMYDRRDVNGTEQRAFAGNFLYSTGANEVAKRFTAGHFDLPLKGCTITLDNRTIVDNGRLCSDLS